MPSLTASQYAAMMKQALKGQPAKIWTPKPRVQAVAQVPAR
jgi:hypothetical protein